MIDCMYIVDSSGFMVDSKDDDQFKNYFDKEAGAIIFKFYRVGLISKVSHLTNIVTLKWYIRLF